MINRNIWDTIQHINEQQFKAVKELNVLDGILNTQIQNRYSGLSGVLMRIYDWLIQNNAAINNAKIIIGNKKITLLELEKQGLELEKQGLELEKQGLELEKQGLLEVAKGQNAKLLTLTKRVTELEGVTELQKSVQQKLESEKQDLLTKVAEQATLLELERVKSLELEKQDLSSKLSEKEKQLLKLTQRVTELELEKQGPSRKAVEKEKVTDGPLTQGKKLQELFPGSVDGEPKLAGEFCVKCTDDSQFKLKILLKYSTTSDGIQNTFRFYCHSDPDKLNKIVENIKLILKEGHPICSNKEIPPDGSFWCFDQDKVFYCEYGVQTDRCLALTDTLSTANLKEVFGVSISAEKFEKEFEDVFEEPHTEEDEYLTRTSMSKKLFQTITNKDGSAAYKNGSLYVGKQTWTPIDSSVKQACDGSFASMGSSVTREICTVNYKESAVIQEVYNKLKQLIDKKEQELLKTEPYDFIGFEQFVLKTTLDQVILAFNGASTEENINKIVDKARSDSTNLYVLHNNKNKIPLIPLDTFITSKAGICRHRAMLFLVLASQLKKDGLLMGEVRQVRGLVEGGAHSWNLYCSPMRQLDSFSRAFKEPSVYLVDAMWKKIGLIDETFSLSYGRRYLTVGEKNITQKLKKHIAGLKKSVTGFISIGWVTHMDRDNAKKIIVNNQSTLGLLIIRNSSTDKKLCILYLTGTKYMFAVPKNQCGSKLLTHFREKLSNVKDLTDFSVRELVGEQLSEIGGQIRHAWVRNCS